MRIWQSIAFAEMDQLDDIARAAERLGYHGVTFGDHWITAQRQLQRYEYSDDGVVLWNADTPWPDPWVQIGALAKITTRLQFMTTVYVLPMRDVFTAAKAISTAALLADGRVVLGAGCGWQQLEFDLVKQPFQKRGRHFDEQLQVLNKLWSGGMVEHHGEFYDFQPLQMTPPPPRKIPILIGGDSDIALARATRHDGWVGAAYPYDNIVPLVQRVTATRDKRGRSADDFTIVVGCYDLTPQRFEQLRELGVTDYLKSTWLVDGRVAPSSLEFKIADMEQFAQQYMR